MICFTYVTLFVMYLSTVQSTDEGFARMFLNGLNRRANDRAHKFAVVTWNYELNLTEENLATVISVQQEIAEEAKRDWLESMKYVSEEFMDYYIKRQFQKYSKLGLEALPPEKLSKLSRIILNMKDLYSKAQICDFHDKKKCDLNIEPELVDIMSSSRDPEELKYVWVAFRKVIGEKIKHMYPVYVSLLNEAAVMNKYTDASDMWLANFELGNIKDIIKNIWLQLKPFYLELHAYVRFKLNQFYGEIVPEHGPIPVHLLGNMWGQSWVDVANLTMPYPRAHIVDITAALVKSRYTPKKMVHIAESFFLSLNLSILPNSFWKNSVFEKPKDRKIVCTPSAEDFFNTNEVGVRLCMEVDERNYLLIHTLIGLIHYYLQYNHQPHIFRHPANNGFYFATGDAATLSITSEKHLQRIGLTKNRPITPYQVMNNLFLRGLDALAFLPFAYVVDLWRWNVFTGKIPPKQYNCKWWEFIHEIQGVQPPVDRLDTDFDPAAKFHIIANQPYIHHFVGFILQFQFHKALCTLAGEYKANDPNKPLYQCDIYGSKAAGNALKLMMQLGSSRPWPDALEILTGERELNAAAIIEFFSPLIDWLKEQNHQNKSPIGWGSPMNTCKNPTLFGSSLRL